MRAALLYQPRDLRVEDVPRPKPGPGEALVRVRSVGVCGSDLHFYQDGRIGDAVVTKPHILGHEYAGVIEDAKFKTYGCGSAIASSSLLTEWVKGKTLDEAGQIKNSQIAEELALPPVKIHCSVLAEDAIKAAISDYKSKHKG